MLYVIGEKVAGGYPEGRYLAVKVQGRVHDQYVIVGVLDMPSVRAVANSSAMSGAKVRRYGSMISYMRGDDRFKEPRKATEAEEETLGGTDADDYIVTVRSAARRQRAHYIERGDTDAALRTVQMASEAIAAAEEEGAKKGAYTDGEAEKIHRQNHILPIH